MADKPRVRVQAGSTRDAATHDSYQNFLSRVGLGTQNQASASTYGFNPISRNRTLLEWMYRGSWVVQRAVDCVAEDMTRAGIELRNMPADDQDNFAEGLDHLCVWESLTDTVRWARLFGGAIAIMLVDGQNPETPLNVGTIGKDQFKGLLVLDRWLAWPSLSDLVTDLGPDLGMPRFYDVPAGMPGLPAMRVHYTRVIRIDGQKLPYFQKWSENGWGASIIEVLYDRLIAFDSTTQGAAQLVYKAHLRTVKVDGLRGIIAAGGAPLAALTKMFEMIRLMQTNEGLTVLDGKDEFESIQYTFSGLDSVLLQFGQQLAGALEIPLVRLFGQSPAGLNATGEADLQIYNEGIASKQKSRLKRGIGTMLQVAYRSIKGVPPAADFGFKFNPLKEMSDQDKAEVAAKEAEAVVGAFSAGVIDRGQALRELRQSGDRTGLFALITDEEIEEADQDPPAGEGADPSDPSAPTNPAPSDDDPRRSIDPNAPTDTPDINHLQPGSLRVVA
jgi:hypothetical protein